jgi:hypothetical protein
LNHLFRRLLSRKSLPFLLALIAIALASPSLQTGWQQDDLVHRYFLLGNPDVTGERASPLDIFRFLDGDTTRARELMDLGVIPWWSLPAVRLSFWRPISALTQWVDYLLWPQNSLLMHVQNLLWFATLVLLAALLYRRHLGATWVAGLAALFFALDDAHGLPAGWLANRNALIAGVFGLLVLLVHDRWRRENWKARTYMGPFFLLLGLLSGESALAACGYLFAYALFIDPGDTRSRVSSLVPYAAVALGWLIIYNMLGYGTYGSGFYVDPISEPFGFIKAVLWKAPLLLTDQWALPPSSIAMFLPAKVLTGLEIWSLVVLTVIAILVVPLVRRDPIARFFFTGMLLSIPLVCATMPHSRLLTFAGIGAFGLLAQWIGGLKEGAEWASKKKAWRFTARVALVLFLIVHIIIAPIVFQVNTTSPAYLQKYIQDPATKVEAGPEFAKQDVILLNHPLVFFAGYFLTSRSLAGLPAPRRVRPLASGSDPIHLYRPDENTLVIRPEGGFLKNPLDALYRGSEFPLRKGDEVHLTGMTVSISDLTPDGRPAAAAFRFATTLNDSSLRWLQWKKGEYAPFVPPAVGDSCVLAGEKLF